jgi:hypothetical protein
MLLALDILSFESPDYAERCDAESRNQMGMLTGV